MDLIHSDTSVSAQAIRRIEGQVCSSRPSFDPIMTAFQSKSHASVFQKLLFSTWTFCRELCYRQCSPPYCLQSFERLSVSVWVHDSVWTLMQSGRSLLFFCSQMALIVLLAVLGHAAPIQSKMWQSSSTCLLKKNKINLSCSNWLVCQLAMV